MKNFSYYPTTNNKNSDNNTNNNNINKNNNAKIILSDTSRTIEELRRSPFATTIKC